MRATEEAGVDRVNMIESHMSLKTDPGLVGFTKKKKKKSGRFIFKLNELKSVRRQRWPGC